MQMQLFQMKEEENKQKSQRELLLEISRIDRKPYQLVHISVLREYLILDMGNTAVEPSFKVDPESRLAEDGEPPEQEGVERLKVRTCRQ